MALNTPAYSFCFWLYVVGNKNGVVGTCMAFNTPYTFKMQCLVWQPLVFLNDIGIHLIGEHLVFGYICMAVQAYTVIVGYYILNFFFGTGCYFIGMRVVVHPAVKVFAMFGGMNAGLVLGFNLFEFELGIFFIASMAVNTCVF